MSKEGPSFLRQALLHVIDTSCMFPMRFSLFYNVVSQNDMFKELRKMKLFHFHAKVIMDSFLDLRSVPKSDLVPLLLKLSSPSLTLGGDGLLSLPHVCGL